MTAWKEYLMKSLKVNIAEWFWPEAFSLSFQIKCKCGLKIEKNHLDFHQVSLMKRFLPDLYLSWLTKILLETLNLACLWVYSLAELWMHSALGALPVLWSGAGFHSVQRARGLLWDAHGALPVLQVQCNVEGASCPSSLVWEPYTTPREEQQPGKSQHSRTTVPGSLVWSPLHPKPSEDPRGRSEE